MNEQQFIAKAFASGLNPQQVSQALSAFRSRSSSQMETKPQQKTIGGFLSNIGSSAANFVGDTAAGIANVFNPNLEKNTVANLGKLAVGTAQYLDPTDTLGTGYEKNVRAVGKALYDRYGTAENIGNTLYNDPVGALGDITGAISGGAGLVSRGANLARMGRVANVAGKVGAVASALDPISLAGSAVRGVAGGAGRMASGVTSKIGSTLQNVGENMAFSGLGNPKIQENIVGISGKNPFEFSQQYDLWDRTPESAQRAIDMVEETSRAKTAGKSVQTGQIIKSIDQELSKLQGGIDDNSKIQRQYLLDKRQEILSGITNPDNSMPINLPSEQVRGFKQQIGRDRPQSSWNLGAAESAKSEAVGTIYDIFKNSLNDLDPNLKQLGKDESALIRYKDLLSKSNARSTARSPLGLSDIATAGAGYAGGGIIPAAAAYTTKKVLETPTAIKAGSKGLVGVGKSLQSIKAPKMPAFAKTAVQKATPAVQAISKARTPARMSQSYLAPKPQDQQKKIKERTFTTPKTTQLSNSSAAFGKTKNVTRGNFY